MAYESEDHNGEPVTVENGSKLVSIEVRVDDPPARKGVYTGDEAVIQAAIEQVCTADWPDEPTTTISVKDVPRGTA